MDHKQFLKWILELNGREQTKAMAKFDHDNEWFCFGGLFHGDPRGPALGVCADGTNLFS